MQKPPQSGTGHAERRWYRFGYADEAVRHTEAWEHETFAEEQARWERTDPAYARICEEARQAKNKGKEASRRADEAKAEWDARAATQRQADDHARKVDHASNADQTPRRPAATSRAATKALRSSRAAVSNSPGTPDHSTQTWTLVARGARQLLAAGEEASEGPHAVICEDLPPDPVMAMGGPVRDFAVTLSDGRRVIGHDRDGEWSVCVYGGDGRLLASGGAGTRLRALEQAGLSGEHAGEVLGHSGI